MKMKLFIIWLAVVSRYSIYSVDLENITRRYLDIEAPVDRAKVKNPYIDSRTPTFSMKVSFTGNFEPLLEKEKTLLNTIYTMRRPLSIFKRVKRKAILKDREGTFAVYLTEAMIKSLQKLGKGKAFFGSFTYVGCCFTEKKESVFILHQILNQKEMAIVDHSKECKLAAIEEIKPGMTFREAIKIAYDKFGEPVTSAEAKLGRTVFGFSVNQQKRLILYLYNGGPDQKNFLHAVQYSIYTEKGAKVNDSLSFGMGLEKFKKLYGDKFRQSEQADTILLEHKVANC